MSKRITLPKYLRQKTNVPTREMSRRGGNKLSEYGRQLREKQKARFTYGLREKQFRNYFNRSAATGAATGEALLQMLESRLDNALYRLNLTISRAQARQFVNHGHILVNGKKVTIPSYLVKLNDTIQLVGIEPQLRDAPIPEWLSYDAKKGIGSVDRLPQRDEIDLDINEQLIVEFYSR